MKILIAGASRGIGKYLADSLFHKGHDVYGTYNHTMPGNHDGINYQFVDASKEVEIIRWIESIEYRNSDELCLINCVGINYNSMIHKSKTEDWINVIQTNLLSAYFMIKHSLPLMKQRNFGRIVLLSSIVPVIGVPGTSAYAASKSALWGLMKSVSSESARFGITTNTLNLGYFNIGMIADVPEESLKSVIDAIPLQKLGDPVNILNAVEFLIHSDYITGAQIDINGGLI